ncbi:sigma-54-dependent Fis family transcriptional regulator [Burkholderia sp. Bp8963]|uniref:sigma-54-dependent Fis family transcriptional regulator n=1 Tax=Burkholderia sp. Bp8963 TaxID=2184547 RepID=UPI0016398F6B|nr:sigma-54-dependent Fis family transcriptional regulator [Burkholderia sp. Bp8963]
MRADIALDERITAVREHFFETGVVGDETISPYLVRSWQRSRSHGMSTSDRRLHDAAHAVSPRQLEEANVDLVRYALPEIEQLRHTFAGDRWIIACLNAEGVVVHTVGGEHASMQALARVLRPGCDLSEQRVGTNGPGCALTERRPMLVRGREHFLDEAGRFACAAVPLIDPFGALVGALDVSYNHTPSQADPLALLASAARAIENQMLDHLPDSVVIRFHYRPDMVDTPYAALLAVSNDGRIIGANRCARSTLGLGDGRLGDRSVSSVLDVPLARLLSIAMSPPSTVPVRLDCGMRVFAYASVHGRMNGRHAEVTARRTTHATSGTAVAPERDQPYLNEDTRVEECFEKARRALSRDIPVIVYGETGTGKEVLVQRLHASGPRHGGPLVAINCFALPASLIESELFGHEYGAFTGAKRGGTAGKIEQANGGTLFLDEIGDLPLELQGRLLRVLQERKVTRLGGHRELPVEFSLICATHQPLRELVAQGKFREDLYYRLTGVSVTLPPLRERSDLLPLIDWLLARESASMPDGSGAYRLDRIALRTLLTYSWPGNIRQLRSVLRAAAALADADCEIRVEHLPGELLDPVGTPRMTADRPASHPGTLAAREADAIRQALEFHNGNVSATARSLGISRATLHRKIHAL